MEKLIVKRGGIIYMGRNLPLWCLVTGNSCSGWQPAPNKKNPWWCHPALSAALLLRRATTLTPVSLCFRWYLRWSKRLKGGMHTARNSGWVEKLPVCRATRKAVEIPTDTSWDIQWGRSCPTTTSPKGDSNDQSYEHFNTHVRRGMGHELYGWSHWRNGIYSTTSS